MTVSKIQVRKGNLADLPILDAGELGYATDKKRLFIGNVAPATITANGSDVDFSFGVDLDNLRGVDGVPYLVTVDDADASGQYTITNSGSTITFGSAPANNAVIKLQYNTELLTYIPDRGDDNVTSVSLDTTGGAVTAPPTTPSSSPLLHANAGGNGTGYYAHSDGGVGGGGGGAGGAGTSSPNGPGPIGDPGKGGVDYLWTGIPTPVMPNIAAGLGTPTKLLGVPLARPENYKRAYAGGGAGGSHSPWNIYNAPWSNEYGTHPDGSNQGGGSGNRTGGKGGLGNSGNGQPGVEGRGGGGGGSGGSPQPGGQGGAGICIVKYAT